MFPSDGTVFSLCSEELLKVILFDLGLGRHLSYNTLVLLQLLNDLEERLLGNSLLILVEFFEQGFDLVLFPLDQAGLRILAESVFICSLLGRHRHVLAEIALSREVLLLLRLFHLHGDTLGVLDGGYFLIQVFLSLGEALVLVNIDCGHGLLLWPVLLCGLVSNLGRLLTLL